jgi:hypothetical protein
VKPQDSCFERETGGGSVFACNEAMKDVLARCCKKVAVQVCTTHDYVFCLYNSVYSIDMPCIVSTTGELIHVTDCCLYIFRRLKINHDSHEFILESGTVANTHMFGGVLQTTSSGTRIFQTP